MPAVENIELALPAPAAAGIFPAGRGLRAMLTASPLASRLVSGAFWSVWGAGLTKVIALACSVAVARLLGKEGFGLYGALAGTLGMFQVFSGFGLTSTANKYVAELRSSDAKRAGCIVGMSAATGVLSGLIVSAVVFAMAPWLAEHVLASPALTWPLRIGAGFILFSSIGCAAVGALSGLEAFRRLARVSLVAGLVTAPLTIASVWWGGLTGAAWSFSLGAALTLALQIAALRREASKAGLHISLAGWRNELRVLWRYSLPALLGALVISPVLWACTVMLVNQPGGYAEMGIYNAAFQWRTAILFLPMAMGNMSLSVLSCLRGEGDPRRYGKALACNLIANAGLAALPALGVALLAPEILGLYGEGFAGRGTVLAVLVASCVVHAPALTLCQALASMGRMWTVFAVNLLWAAVLLGTTAATLHLRATGLGLGILAAYTTQLLVTGLAVWILLRRWKSAAASRGEAVET